jgi:serine/threonine-protein kinase
MADDSRVFGLLEEMLVSGVTPEEVCRDCPELLMEVRQRWKQLGPIDAEFGALFPESETIRCGDPVMPGQLAALPQVPGYEVEAVLGYGGMGVVYRARHLRLNRTVALKMLLAGPYARPEELRRFRWEAEAVAGLRHPNIVQVHDSGDLDGRPYFVMEFIEGGSLARRLAGQVLPPRDVARLAATLAEAMHLAHSRNLVHRDLKPANVLLAGGAHTPISQCQPKVTDFGLVRQLDADSGQTQVGVVMGTPSYMAPEQAEGRTHAAGPAADVYALGAILYECLTGRPPFVGATPLETLEQVRTREPAVPSSLNRHVPCDLETICLKCLRKQPEQRYSSARELADDLGRFVRGEPVAARPVGVAERALKWVRRRPTAALLVAALLVLFGSAAGISLWLRHQEENRQAAKAQRERHARGAIETALKRADDRRRGERWREGLLILSEASTHLAEANSPPLEQRLQHALSDFRFAADLEQVRQSGPLEHHNQPQYKRQAAAFRVTFERGGIPIGDDAKTAADSIRASAIHDQLVAALDDWALAAFIVNDRPLVNQLLRVARLADPEPRWRDRFRDTDNWGSPEHLLELAEDAFNTSPPPSGHHLALLSLLLRRCGGRADQGTNLVLVGEACRRQPDNFWLNREMGLLLRNQARFLESIAYFRTAVALRPDSAGVHEGLGDALLAAGQVEAALAAYRRAVELSADSLSTRGALVGALADTGHWVEAADEVRRALDANPSDYEAPDRLGWALWLQGRGEEAIVLCRKAVKSDPSTHRAWFRLAVVSSRTNRHDEAVTALRKLTHMNPKHVGHQMLAAELAVMGRLEEAIAELQTATTLLPDQPKNYADLGALLRAQKRPEEAATAFQKATTLSPRGQAGHAGWSGLAAARLDQGRFADARAATIRLLDLPATEAERRAQRRQIDLCEALLSIDADLPAILAGKERPAKASTQLALAEWCLKHKRLTATAAGFYRSALAAEPSLADDLEVGNRFQAACAAALASSGVGEDATKLDDRERALLRQQALDWLTAEYNAWAERHRLGKRGDHTVAAAAVRSWLKSEDLANSPLAKITVQQIDEISRHSDGLAGVRDEQALARLPLEERRAWQTFWANVVTLAGRDPVALLERARMHVGRRVWGKAAKLYAEAFELEPTDDGEVWFEYAATQLLAGDREGYRRTCANRLARVDPKWPMRGYLVARACTLAPDSVDDPTQPEKLAAFELGGNPNAFWALTARAASHYRTGQFREAVWLAKASLSADGRPGRALLNWLWLALAYQKLGKTDEARRWLDKAAGWLDQQEGRMPLNTSSMGMHRLTWLEAHVLRQEAENLLR